MADPSVGDDIAVAGILANLLALPKSIPQEYQGAQQQRQLLTQMGGTMGGPGLSPAQLDQLAPLPAMHDFPGANVPVLGSVLRGIGTTGQMLQRVLGTAPAPRPPMEQLMDYAKLRYTGAETERAQAEAEKARRTTSDLGKQPWIDQGLTPEEARKRMGSQSNAEFATWQREHPDSKTPVEDFETWKSTLATKKAGDIADIKERHGNLPPAAQNTLASLDTVDQLATDMENMLNDPEVQANTGIFAGRLAQRLYQLGLANPGEDPFLALQAQVQVLGATPYMRGTRNMLWVQQIQQHLPKPGDQPQLIRDKLTQLHRLTDVLSKSTMKEALRTKSDLRRELGVEQPGEPVGGAGAMTPDDMLQQLRAIHEDSSLNDDQKIQKAVELRKAHPEIKLNQ